jgi:uncharacterized repeat protein (TIGR01451 family)
LYHETKFLTPINFIFMKRLIVMLCVLCFHGFAFGQGWQRILNDSLRPHSVCNDYDDGFIVAGITPKGTCGIIKTDSKGNKIYFKEFSDFVVIDQGLSSFTLVKINQSPDSTFTLSGNENNGIIIKQLDKKGLSKWSKTIPLDYGIIKQINREYILVGKSRITAGTPILRLNLKGDTVSETYASFGRTMDFQIQKDGLVFAEFFSNRVYKVGFDGNPIWSKSYIGGNFGRFSNFIQSIDSTIFINPETNELKKISKAGDLIWSKNTNLGPQSKFILAKNQAVIGIKREKSESVIFSKYDKDGNLVWTKDYRIGTNVLRDIIRCKDGYILLGEFSNVQTPLLFKVDEDGNIYPNNLTGSIFNDIDKNCQKTNADKPIKSCTIEAKKDNGEVFWGVSDSIGNYFINIDSGAYNIKAYRSQSANLWQPCTPSVSKTFSSLKKTDTVDFLLKPIIDCPAMNVQVSTPFLRRCFNNTYTVNYCNRGTIKAQNAYVTVTLDSLLEYINSSKSITSQSGRTLRFNLGDVAVDDCGSFDITTRVRCGDSTRLGQTLCVEAKIYPDTVCSDLSLWSGASMEVTGSCLKDSVLFQIKNVGRAASSSLNSIVIEDEVLFLRQPVQLPINGVFSKKFPANGKTWRMVVNQEPNHPTSFNPTAFVEGCRANNALPFSTGFATRFPNDDKATTIDVDCQIIQGAFDPNDKIGYPTGYKNDHFVAQNQDIEYKIRFQNTGTDTAFTVVVRDTISDKMDIPSIEFGASSHKYEAEIYGKGILKFTFNNINLVDSFKNEAKSHGFIQYRIKQKKDLAWGSKIYNSAGIYFDFNDPVLTNQTLHTVGAREIISAVVERTIEPNFPVKISPNPFSESAVFEGPLSILGDFQLFDITGKLLRNEPFEGTSFEFHRKGLSAGIYVFKISEGGKLLSVGKLVVQ